MRKEFYDTSLFPFVKKLEKNYNRILEDYYLCQNEMIQWPEERLNPENRWLVCGLYDFPHGNKVPTKATWTQNFIKEHIKGHKTAGFSILSKNTKIPPHTGYQGNVLRCHLGLIVPEGDLGIRVLDKTVKWETGKCFVMDDRLLHEAWNNSNEDRVVLIVDFEEGQYL